MSIYVTCKINRSAKELLEGQPSKVDIRVSVPLPADTLAELESLGLLDQALTVVNSDYSYYPETVFGSVPTLTEALVTAIELQRARDRKEETKHADLLNRILAMYPQDLLYRNDTRIPIEHDPRINSIWADTWHVRSRLFNGPDIPWDAPALLAKRVACEEITTYLNQQAVAAALADKRKELDEREARNAREAAAEALRKRILAEKLSPEDNERREAGYLADKEARGLLITALLGEPLPHFESSFEHWKTVDCEEMTREEFVAYKAAKEKIDGVLAALPDGVTGKCEPRRLEQWNGERDDDYPDESTREYDEDPPIAIRVTLTVGDWTDLRRLFAV